MTEALLDSGATGLVMSEEFVRKYKFRRTNVIVQGYGQTLARVRVSWTKIR